MDRPSLARILKRDIQSTASWKLALALVAALGLVAFTSTKLIGMARIRGWVGEVIHEAHVVTGKRIDRRVCWVAWDDAKPRGWEPQAVQIPRARCSEVNVGDEIEIVRLRANGLTYLEDGVYASDGNFVFDLVLLSLECVAALFLGIVLARRRST